MDFQRIAELEVMLEGIRLPATRDELVACAEREDAAAAAELARIPDVTYDRIDAVGNALRLQARGGGDYVGPRAERRDARSF
jgi:Protein of unknown function (DUF2795)